MIELPSFLFIGRQCGDQRQSKGSVTKMVLPLPMIKLGGLIIRTLTKPVAKSVKTSAKIHPRLNALCHGLGQQQHRWLLRFHMGYRGVSNYTIKDLSPDQAVEKGADLIGEILIFSVAVAVASFEYSRSSEKSKQKERIEAEQKRLQEEVCLVLYKCV
jgi:hypothetical protein